MTAGSVPANCVVTGGSGFVGQRLVEMLLERGAKRVVSFDIAPRPATGTDDARVEFVQGDLGDTELVNRVVQGADCVWHVAALVGPYHPHHLYTKVNYDGTVNILNACKKHGVPKIVMSSSPSTRMDGNDIDGLSEDEMSFPRTFLQEYARTKALGEQAVRSACCPELLTVAVAPHHVYGPRDALFLPNILAAGQSGRLRVVGGGKNRISFTHVDNYCHGLILGEKALYPQSPALGKYYVVTDGGYEIFWDRIDEACVSMGFPSPKSKFHAPAWLVMCFAYICSIAGAVFRTHFKLSPFSVRMLTIHRWFNIDNAKRDLGSIPTLFVC